MAYNAMPGMYAKESDSEMTAMLTRRGFLELIGKATVAGAVVAFVPGTELQEAAHRYATGGVVSTTDLERYSFDSRLCGFPITPNGGDITVYLPDDTEVTLHAAAGPAIESLEDFLQQATKERRSTE